MPLVGAYLEQTKRLVREALDRAGVATLEDWVTQNPGKHLWIELSWDDTKIPACAACTAVRFGRDGSKNKPCRGIAPPVRLNRE